jgi:hypothetical protein
MCKTDGLTDGFFRGGSTENGLRYVLVVSRNLQNIKKYGIHPMCCGDVF